MRVFPNPRQTCRATDGSDDGMDLRDLFAGLALHGLVLGNTAAERPITSPGFLAELSYRLADAMLAARNPEPADTSVGPLVGGTVSVELDSPDEKLRAARVETCTRLTQIRGRLLTIKTQIEEAPPGWRKAGIFDLIQQADSLAAEAYELNDDDDLDSPEQAEPGKAGG